MGEIELDMASGELRVYANIILYGDAAHLELSKKVADEIASAWNEPMAEIWHKDQYCRLIFVVTGEYAADLSPEWIYYNTNARNNYFRVEEYAHGNISFVDDIGCNTGYFKLDNLMNDSKTAAHEFGHTLGLLHPVQLDIRGQGTPGIMYPRGTIVDPEFQYDPAAQPLAPGGTMNPATRKVLLSDIADLQFDKIHPDLQGRSILGAFSSNWHAAHPPGKPFIPNGSA